MRGLRRIARDATVLTVSVGVVLFLVAYAVADPGIKLAAVAGDVRNHAGRQAIVHGQLREPSGYDVRDVVVDVQGPAISRTGRTDERGFFRVNVMGRCAQYRISLRGRWRDRTVTTHLDHRLCPGDELEVGARVLTDGQFIWMPTR